MKRFGWSLVLVLTAVISRGQDRTAATPSDDSISAAKRDFDSLKGARSSLESSRLELPQVSSPGIHIAPEDTTIYNQAQAAKRKERERDPRKAAKSGNWLVDAMMTKPESTAAAENKPAEAFTAPEDRPAPTLLSLNNEEIARADAKNAAKDNDKATPSVADNPLNSYMSSWMTPKDFDLLKVKPADAGVPSVAADRGTPANFDNAMRDLGGVDLGKPAGAGPADRSSNPYLSDLAPVSLPAPKETVNLPLPAVPSDAPSAALAPIAPKNDFAPARPASPANDLLKPSQDAKYFPQLKRF